MLGKNALKWLDDNSKHLAKISDKIWDYSEIALAEIKSADLIVNELRDNGFEVEKGIAGMPTAFRAIWGSGKPVIGLLAEYDALIGSSQKRAWAKKESIVENGPGHACGHNLLGTALLGTALSVQKEMKEINQQGTVVLFGCPAEETLTGKVFMAREGFFDNVDVFLTWHPHTVNSISEEIWQSMINVKFNFYGISAHASMSPEDGRSALDAVELMNVGANYLREHIVDSATVHYTITYGGSQPNTVPDYAQVWYFVRGPKREVAEEVFEKLKKIARGAALMTETKMDVEFITASPENLPNGVLCEILYGCMKRLPEIIWDKEEIAFAKRIVETVLPESYKRQIYNLNIKADEEIYLYGKVLPLTKVFPHMRIGSTDVSDASWCAPTAQIYTACYPLGTAAHSWQWASISGTSIGHKGMMLASKTLSLACLELMNNLELVRAAKDEFIARREGGKFISMVPKSVNIPL
jgi:aminobenzoyl-glutamate utilization protein B